MEPTIHYPHDDDVDSTHSSNSDAGDDVNPPLVEGITDSLVDGPSESSPHDTGNNCKEIKTTLAPTFIGTGRI